MLQIILYLKARSVLYRGYFNSVLLRCPYSLPSNVEIFPALLLGKDRVNKSVLILRTGSLYSDNICVKLDSLMSAVGFYYVLIACRVINARDAHCFGPLAI